MTSVRCSEGEAAPPASRFRLSVHGPDRGTLDGEIDIGNVAAFESALAEAVASTACLELSCGGLRFVDLAGMRAIAAVARSRPGFRLVLESPPRAFVRCWRLAAFDLDQAVVEVHLPLIGVA